jgi:hypothetical protein
MELISFLFEDVEKISILQIKKQKKVSFINDFVS